MRGNRVVFGKVTGCAAATVSRRVDVGFRFAGKIASSISCRAVRLETNRSGFC